ncbi:MAG: hypothetical protein J6Y58_11185 [Clostridiales bacterium]|nr:hypothetical protein [Clostridiales bacterium]
MKTLKEVVSVIKKTDCYENLRVGWSRSMPILTKDESGVLIDNYFTYADSISNGSVSSPIAVFGVYTDEEKTAYNNMFPKDERKSFSMDVSTIDHLAVSEAYDRFKELFPEVRECTYKECTDEQKALVKEYVSCLETFSGPIIWKFYQELFPSFFEWANSL